MIKVAPVPESQIEFAFNLVDHYLQNVYDKTDMIHTITPACIKDKLHERLMQLWVGYIPSKEVVGFALTKIDQYPIGRTCTIVACGAAEGYDHDWDEYIQTIEGWAKNQEDCVLMFVDGRAGWSRKLKESGYKVDSVILSKRLKPDEDHDTASPPMEQRH